MITKRKELAEAVLGIIEKNGNPQRTAEAVAAYLISERRTGELNALLRDLEELRYRQDGILEMTATAARRLDAETKKELQKLFQAKRVVVNEETEPELLGGVRVRALDKAADFSVQARLRRLRKGNT